MKKYQVFFIDPQSARNLAIYDHELLTNIPIKGEILFLGNSRYNFNDGTVDFIPLFHYQDYNLKLISGLSYVISLIKLLFLTFKYKPKVVHWQWIKIYKLDYLFIGLLKKRGIKIVYTAHNIFPHDDMEGNNMGFLMKFYNLIDKIIVHTSVGKDELVNLFNIDEGNIAVIPIGIMHIIFSEKNVAVKTKEIFDKYNLKDKIIFLSIGNQSIYKGYNLLKKVWVENPEFASNDNICLFVAGFKHQNIDSSDYKKCKNVFLMEYNITDDEYIALSRLSSVILMPYIKITQSGVLMQALHDRIPFVVTERGGLTDPLKIAKVGWNIGEPTEENLKDCINNLIIHPQLINDIKNDVEKWDLVNEAFSWKFSGQKTGDVYNIYL